MAEKDITLLIAHPDDEVIFLWPFLNRVNCIVCVSDDSRNPDRVWCKERGKCLEEVGQLLGCEVLHWTFSSEFYRLPTRDKQLYRIAEALIDYKLPQTGIVATHNPWGEYGHLDHILCNHIAMTWKWRGDAHERQVLTTDIATEINWLPISTPHHREYGGFCEGDFTLDRALYDRIKAIYDAKGCWTWSFDPVTECRVFSL